MTAATFGLIASLVAPDAALAHRHAHRGRIRIANRVYSQSQPRHVRPGSFTPPFSAYAVDGNSGRVLFGRDENELRHPASITKVMTLYLLFDQIERGHLTLDSRLEVSAHAAAQAPTKLGLRAGSTIRVEDAIKAIVTKSANDMAVAVAERIGGDEATFAAMMTRRAHALGMSRTTYVNASGLPDDRQLTTAHDLVTLGMAIHDHFPRYFRYFSTPSFTYAGQFMPNHNHLMEQVEGMDGIKTGYTRSSGFNLLSSVNRNGHWLVSVVVGGKTRLGRDRIMADLIAAQIDHCSTSRTAPMIAENTALEQHEAEAIPVVQHVGEPAPPVEAVDEEAAEERPAVPEQRAAEPAPAPEQPQQVETAEAQDSPEADQAPEPAPAPPPPRRRPAAPAKPTPVKVAVLKPEKAQPHPRPAFASPAFAANVPRPPERDMLTTASIHLRQARLDGATPRYEGPSTATPSSRHARREAEAGGKGHLVKLASLESDAPEPIGRPTAHGGVIVQIGATDNLAKANDLIARAKGQNHALSGAHSFTEKVQKGKSTLFRARFAGLDPAAADGVCKSLKHAGFACFTTKN